MPFASMLVGRCTELHQRIVLNNTCLLPSLSDMDLPVEKWKVYVSQKWTSLDPLLKDKLCLTGSLRDSFLQAWALFQ